MKFLDLFAGIGGFRLGMEQAGHECIGFCEIDKFARASYKAIHNTEGEVEMHDITSVSDEFIRGIGDIDIICGGFPCQAFSIAGKRQGFEDTRGTLFFEIARFASILRPRFLFLENVKGLLNHEGGATFETILRALDELGYDAEWEVHNSKDYVPQNRERVFVVGHLRGERTEQVFPFERESRGIDKESGRINIVGSTKRKYQSSLGQREVVYSSKGLVGALTATDYKGPKQIAIPVLTPDRTEKRQNGRRFKEDGEEMFTLTAQDRHGVAILQKPRGYNEGGLHDISPTLSSHSWHENNLLSIGGVYTNDSQRFNRGVLPGLSRTLKASKSDAGIYDGFQIRKLTPRECWRLQGFPDWAFDRAKEVNSDSQLYKQAGNSVTVPVIHDIARRLVSYPTK